MPGGAYDASRSASLSTFSVRNHLRAGESEMSNRCVDDESVVDVVGFGGSCVLDVGTLVALAADDVAGCVTCDVVTGGCIPYSGACS